MKVTIVGARVTGLKLGYLLVKKGFDVTVLEKEARVGGLAKSYHYNGWSIDIGPHRFHTDRANAPQQINDLLFVIRELKHVELLADNQTYKLSIQ